ncbi:MAG: DUF72 domain-containing protein [Chitinophagaceae bacterium]
MLNQSGRILIGTSNVVVLGNKQSFPVAFQLRSRLHYYSSIFNTLEVNSSFYKTPLLSTYKKWSLDVPEDFQFSLKLSKSVTHTKDLQNDLTGIEQFMTSAGGVANKKGCLLIQFPGKISLHYYKQVEQILQQVQAHDPNDEWRKAIEFRNNSWYISETFELLDEYNAVTVLHDHPKAKIFDVKGKADFIYFRFHGPKGDYRDSYTNSFLEEKAAQIKACLTKGKDVYAYFNNTIGSAFENALTLKNLLQSVL